MTERASVVYDAVPGAVGDPPAAVVLTLPNDGTAPAIVRDALREARAAGDKWPGQWLARRRGWLVLREHWRAVKAKLEAAGYRVERRGDYRG
jgi:hypothetical protein